MLSPIPQRFPTVCIDLAAALLRNAGEMMIQLELEFDQSLDADRLARALALAMDAEPVLGCRFVADPKHPYWLCLPEPAKDVLTIVADDAEYEAFVHRLAIAADGPQFHAALQRRPTGDRLCIKATHEAGDAAGAKEIGALVASIYRRLRREPDWRPTPNLLGSRGIWQLVRRLPWTAFFRIHWNLAHATIATYRPWRTHKIPWNAGPRGPLQVIRRHLPADRVARLADYGRERGATINDMFMAAYYRAQAKVGGWNGREVLRLSHTVDLRRYLPHKKTESITNFSGIEHHCLGLDLGAGFNATLAMVSTAMKLRKASWFGINDFIGALPLFSVFPFHRLEAFFRFVFNAVTDGHNLENGWTNMGPIDPESLIFEDRPRAAWLLVPPMYPPNLVVGLTGFAGALTLSIGVYPEAGPPHIADDFIDALIAELPLTD